MKIYGPYTFRTGSCAGRRYVRLVHPDGSRRQLLYSRWLMEKKLGRRLSPGEHVDHVDDDKTNDSIENLQVLSASRHAKKHRPSGAARVTTFRCPVCGKKSSKPTRKVEANRSQGKAGPFCGKRCSWRWQRQAGIGLGAARKRR